MAGRGPAPKPRRRNASDKPIRGEWQPTPGIGWQHGPLPEPPDGLLEVSRKTWAIWFASWFAAHWTADNVPDVETAILLFDQVRRGEHQRATELRLWEDNCGISLKGQQDRRWIRPQREEAAPSSPPRAKRRAPADPYGHLRVVNE
jgi:hypothetical protein